MKIKLITRVGTGLLSYALLSPMVTMAQDHHDEHKYYDAKRKDYHSWDAHEDQAYKMYWAQRHRPYVAFDSLNQRDQAAYWAWRHDHSDALLKIDIR